MILFVVFGLPIVTASHEAPLPPMIVNVPAAELQNAVRLHRDEGLTVRILDYGAPPAPAAERPTRGAGTGAAAVTNGAAATDSSGAAAASPVAPAPAAAGSATAAATGLAKVEILGAPTALSTGELHIGKQMLTAIITLLTTVIGFYFGSKSAGDGAKDKQATGAGGKEGEGKGGKTEAA